MPTSSKYYTRNRERILERQRAKRAEERAKREAAKVADVPKSNSISSFKITHGVYVVKFD
jgi:hypothetical protein